MLLRDDQYAAPRIRVERVKCKCDSPDCSGKLYDPIKRPRTALMLRYAGELLKEYENCYDHSWHITSCQRCEYHNMAVGGAENSGHVHNVAIDIVTDGPVLDLVLLAEQQGVWSSIIWNLKTGQVHLDLHPDDKVRRGHVDSAGVYRVRVLGDRHGSPLRPAYALSTTVYAWNLDEEDDCPPYINAALQRSGTDGI